MTATSALGDICPTRFCKSSESFEEGRRLGGGVLPSDCAATGGCIRGAAIIVTRTRTTVINRMQHCVRNLFNRIKRSLTAPTFGCADDAVRAAIILLLVMQV